MSKRIDVEVVNHTAMPGQEILLMKETFFFSGAGEVHLMADVPMRVLGPLNQLIGFQDKGKFYPVKNDS